MSDVQPDEIVEVAEATPLRNQRGAAVSYREARKAAKAQAADTIAANAKEAEKAKKKALAKSVPDGRADFNKRALAIEKKLNSKTEGE